jgi:UDP-glucose 4-epimerase
MRIAVTGGGGFIGAHVVRHLEAEGHQVDPLDLAGTDDPVDITDQAALEQRFAGLDGGIHLAAVADFADCDADPFRAHEVNAGGTLAVLLAAKEAQVPRVVYASTFWAYDGAPGETVDEDTVLDDAANIYTATKLAGEAYCHAVSGPEVVVCRLGTAYGPGARPNLMTSRMLSLAMAGEPLTVNGDGKQGRQLVFVEDLAEGLARALRDGRPDTTYNLVGARMVSVNDVVEAVRTLLGEVSVVNMPDRPGDVRMPFVLAERAADELGWRPATSLLDGLTEQADELRSAIAN